MINKATLSPYFKRKSDILAMFPMHQVHNQIKRERYVYVDNGAPSLLVAHIDTVQTPRLDSANRGAGFDDRLGVYLGHTLATERPDLFDLLLTDYEECGRSTAEFFEPTHAYRLVVGLDREGDDYVDYGLASDELRDALARDGFIRGVGSYSDVCIMGHVRCNKFNVGLGIAGSHSAHSTFDQGVFERQTRRLMAFVERHRDTTWPDVVEVEVDEWGPWGLWDDMGGRRIGLDRRWAERLAWMEEEEDMLMSDATVELVECLGCGEVGHVNVMEWSDMLGGYLCGVCYCALHV